MEQKQDKPISEIIIAQDFEVVAIPLTKKRLYKADDVDKFLTDISQDVEVLENAAKEVLERYEKLRKGRVAETDPDIGNITIEMNDSEIMQKLRAKEKQIERTKNHMSELLKSAEKRADEIVQEAIEEGNATIARAQAEAQQIIAEAQQRGNEIAKLAQDKVEEVKMVKVQLHESVKEMQSEFGLKANEIDKLQQSLNRISQQLREYSLERTA